MQQRLLAFRCHPKEVQRFKALSYVTCEGSVIFRNYRIRISSLQFEASRFLVRKRSRTSDSGPIKGLGSGQQRAETGPALSLRDLDGQSRALPAFGDSCG